MRGLLIALTLLASSPAAAQEARDVTVAREEFRAGIEAARAGDWETARGHFERSYGLNPRPSALFNLAGAEARIGALVSAAERYREYLAHRDDGNAGRIAGAEAALAELEPRIPTVTVRIDGLAADDEVRLDDAPIRRLLLDGPIPVDPGPHRVSVIRGGEEVAHGGIDAPEGARMTLTIDVPPVVTPPHDVTLEPPVEPQPAALGLATTPQDDTENVLESWWLWTIIGGVVAIGVVSAIAIAVTTPGEPPQSLGFTFSAPVRVP